MNERALLGRINRRLAARTGERMSKLCESHRSMYYGHDYIILNDRNTIVGGTSDLEVFARDLGVMTPAEALA